MKMIFNLFRRWEGLLTLCLASPMLVILIESFKWIYTSGATTLLLYGVIISLFVLGPLAMFICMVCTKNAHLFLTLRYALRLSFIIGSLIGVVVGLFLIWTPYNTPWERVLLLFFHKGQKVWGIASWPLNNYLVILLYSLAIICSVLYGCLSFLLMRRTNKIKYSVIGGLCASLCAPLLPFFLGSVFFSVYLSMHAKSGDLFRFFLMYGCATEFLAQLSLALLGGLGGIISAKLYSMKIHRVSSV